MIIDNANQISTDVSIKIYLLIRKKYGKEMKIIFFFEENRLMREEINFHQLQFFFYKKN